MARDLDRAERDARQILEEQRNADGDHFAGMPDDLDNGLSMGQKKWNPEKRYWVYAHDADNEIIENIADVDELKHAIDAVGDYLHRLYPQYSGVTVRVVDNSTSATVWIAGPKEKTELERLLAERTELEVAQEALREPELFGQTEDGKIVLKEGKVH